MLIQEFFSKLESVRPVHGGWMARCPAHPDRTPSLSVSEGKGKILLKCQAGCETSAVVAALGLSMSDLFAEPKPNGHGRRIVATYDYTDESGKLLFQVARFDPKDFRQCRPDGKGGWTWNLKGVRRVLYKLPAVLEAKAVLLLEGEKDVEAARKIELVATCNPHGAGKWRPEYSESLRGKRVAVICDADAPGLAHGRDVARAIIGVAASVKLIEALPQSKDLTEWVERGGTRDALIRIILNTPELTSADVAKWQPAKASGFTLTPLGELMSKPDVPVEYVWEGRLAAGTVSAIVSKPKVGKSTLARALCLAIARGDDFLGFPTKPGECIYVALEEREEDVRNDFRAMGANGSEPILIHAAAAPAEGIRLLCDLVREKRPRLVVIDPLFRLARVRDEKAYAETYNALGPLIDVARESGTHVMLVHHSGKGAAKADPIDSPLGSTAIGGAASPLIVLKRTEAYRVIQTVQRIGQDMPETVLQFDPETKRLSVGGTREEAEIESLSGAILEFLEAEGEPKAEPEINEGTEGKTKAKCAALRKLVADGKVCRKGTGKRGDPYFYFSPSHYIAGSREVETQKPADARLNTNRNLVPVSEQKSFLVPAGKEAPKAPISGAGNRPGLTPESSPDTMEV